MAPTMANGKICYVEMPATDVERSATFYENVFGWRIRRRGDGQLAFDDGVGEVSGTWVVSRSPMTDPGLLIYIMVDSVAGTIDLVRAHGGEVVQPIGADAPEITARFRDPGGNVWVCTRNLSAPLIPDVPAVFEPRWERRSAEAPVARQLSAALLLAPGGAVEPQRWAAGRAI